MAQPVRTWGDGSRRALLIHGLLSSSKGWWRVGPALADVGFTVVAPDLRGHGDYGPTEDLSFAAQAEDLVALGEGWDLVVGHSMGGTIALVAQTQSATWAKRMVLIDPSIWVPSEPEVEARFTEAYRQPITQEAIMRANPTWHPSDAAHKVEALENASPEIAIQTVRQNDPWNVAREVAQVSVPTLILGADPRLQPRVPALLGESLAAINARVAFQVVPHASHSMHRDEYEETLRLIRDWVGSDADRIEHET